MADHEDESGITIFSRRPTKRRMIKRSSQTQKEKKKSKKNASPKRLPPNEMTVTPQGLIDEAMDEELVSFQSLGISRWLEDNCRTVGIRNPTRIQKHCIPPILKGKNVIGAAETGSGKTAAFALPILQELAKDPYGVFAVILTPTRELAFQIAEQFTVFSRSMCCRQSVIVGGMDMTKQSLELSKHPHIIIATPGRLAGHLNTATGLRLNMVRYIVLDEADRLLTSTFEKDLARIVSDLPAAHKRQTLLFSATMTEDIKFLENASAREKEEGTTFFRYDDCKVGGTTVENLTQEYLFTPLQVRHCYLVYLLRRFEKSSAIIFCGTCRTVELLHHALQELEIDSVPLHSMLPQAHRLRSLAQFKGSMVRILIATDVASRGLDIPQVSLVINYDVPAAPEDYIHRVGRTARAGRDGRSVTLVTQYDIERIQGIEAHTGKKLVEFEAAEDSILNHLSEASAAIRVASVQLNESGFEDRARERKRKRVAALEKKRSMTKNRSQNKSKNKKN